MYLAHGPISYILNETIQKKAISKLTKQEHILVMILSILFGIFPDVDLAVLSMTNIPSFQHHLVFTHSILFFVFLWVLLNIFFWILKKILNKESRIVLKDSLLNVIQWSFLIGTLSHLFADILFSYSMSLFPLQQQITILGGVLKTNYFASSIFTPSFATEILSIGVFVLLIVRKYIKKFKIVEFLTYSFIAISSIYLLFTVYMNLNTYNKAYQFENGIKLHDTDYDGIKDRFDTDTNNNGVNNILEVNRSEMVTFIKSISDGKYLVTNTNDTVDKIKYGFGAFGSYRLISQTFFDQNLPIEPVLIQYAKTKYNIQGYNIDIPYPTLLYEYLIENGSLYYFNPYLDTGKIFFVIENEKVLNMGIVLDKDLFGIVLLNDKKLITHTQEDILNDYENADIKVVSILKQE